MSTTSSPADTAWNPVLPRDLSESPAYLIDKSPRLTTRPQEVPK